MNTSKKFVEDDKVSHEIFSISKTSSHQDKQVTMKTLFELTSRNEFDLESVKQTDQIEKNTLLDDLEQIKVLPIVEFTCEPNNQQMESLTKRFEFLEKNLDIKRLNKASFLDKTGNTSIINDNVETKIAQQLKLWCNEKGEETTPQKSAHFLYQLGLVYQIRNSDMANFIKSAALMNAALTRKPENHKKIQHDLKMLCKHVLTVSNAKDRQADLIEKASHVKKNIVLMRTRTNEQLKRIANPNVTANNEKDFKSMSEHKKINALRKLQIKITNDYTDIMTDVAKYCENIMGKPPCKFSVVGMGSLSRQEITPYSDFEHIILIQNESSNNDVLTYFRWFTVIFHIIIINLQETIIPSAAISCLNDTTKPYGDWFYDFITVHGISFDGMMPHACKIPLGRQQHTAAKPWKTELIKSVDDMLKYLSGEESLKNGYHLSEMLTSTCFVYGDKSLFRDFQLGVFEFNKNREKSDIIESVKKQLSDDLSKFATKSNITQLQSQQPFNIKSVIYRSTTLFITALARLNDIPSSSSFEIIEELSAKKIITDYQKQKLLFAVALACEIRLRLYMTKESQQDQVERLKELVDLVGDVNIISYFQIAYALQCDISKQVDLKQIYFYSNLQLVNVSLSCCFNDDQQLVKHLNKTKVINRNHERLYSFDNCLMYLENDGTKADEDDEKTKVWELLLSIADCLYESECFDDAYDFYTKALKRLEHTEIELSISNTIVAHCQHRIGVCLLSLQRHEEAFNSLKTALVSRLNSSFNINYDMAVAFTMRRFACCLLSMKSHKDALKFLLWSLQIKVLQSQFIESDKTIADTLFDIGICFTSMQEFCEAMKYFNKALQIEVQSSENIELNRRVAYVLLKIGKCLSCLEKCDQAMLFLRKALEIKENTSFNIAVDQDIASVSHEIGCCFLNMGKPDEAKIWLYKALKIKERISLDVDGDKSIAVTMSKLNICLKKEEGSEIYFGMSENENDATDATILDLKPSGTMLHFG